MRCRRVRRVQLEHPAALVLRPRQSLDLHLLDLLRIQLDVFLDFQPVRFGSSVGVGVEADRVLKVLDFRHAPRAPGRPPQLDWLRRLVLDRKVRLGHRRGSCGGGRGGLPLGARQRFGRVAIHRVGVQKPRQPLDLFVVLPVPLSQLGEPTQGDDVFAVEAQDLLEDTERAGVVFLVDEAAGVDDVGADVIGMQLETVLTELDRVIYKPCFTIGVRQGGEVSALGVVPVARFELVDLAGVGHA